MAVKANAKKVVKKRVKKNIDRGQAHIQSSFNNTIVTVRMRCEEKHEQQSPSNAAFVKAFNIIKIRVSSFHKCNLLAKIRRIE